VQLAPLEVGDAAERIDELTRLEPACDRVHGEVAAPHVVLDRRGRVGHDLEVVMPWPRAPLDPRRGQLDPPGRERGNRWIGRVEPHPDELAVHLHVLDAPMRLEGGTELRMVDAGDEKILVRVRDPEQLVAHRAAHDVRVEAE
jgi:hypothetical protein